MRKTLSLIFVSFFVLFAFVSCSNSYLEVIPKSANTAAVCAKDRSKVPSNLSIPSTIDGYKIVTIGNFEKCEKIRKVTIPEGVTDIGAGAFYRCSNLTSVYLPASLQHFWTDSIVEGGTHPFYSCYRLQVIEYGGTYEQWCKLRIGGDKITWASDLVGSGGQKITLKCKDKTVTLK